MYVCLSDGHSSNLVTGQPNLAAWLTVTLRGFYAKLRFRLGRHSTTTSKENMKKIDVCVYIYSNKVLNKWTVHGKSPFTTTDPNQGSVIPIMLIDLIQL